MLAFAIYITHGLACYVAIDITWNDYMLKNLKNSNHKVIWEYITRTALVLVTCKFVKHNTQFIQQIKSTFDFTVLLAVAIPNLELFISLFGALCLSALGLAFPAAIDMCIFWYQSKGTAKVWLIIRNVLIIFIGVLGLVTGTYTSLSEIIKTFFD